MKRAAIYARVSTDEQAKHGYSIGAQLESLREYAQQNRYKVAGEYVDEGISARKSYKKRPALLQLLRAVEADQIDTILFIKLDRWFRNVQSYYEVQPILEKHGVAWKATQEDYETETASGRFKVNIMLSVAQDEADRTSERIKFIFENKKAKGEICSGAVPLGLKIVEKKVVEDPDTAPIVREAFNKYIDIRSCCGLSRYMTSTHKVMYSDKGVRLLLENHRLVDAGVIDEATFAKVQSILAERSRRGSSEKKYTYLFGGLCKCAECGGAMKHNRTTVMLYSCAKRSRYGKQGCVHGRYTNEELIEQALVTGLLNEAENYNYELQQKSKAPKVDRAALKKKMEKLTDLYMNDLIDYEDYQRRYTELREASEALPTPQTLIDTSELKNALSAYGELDREHKSAFWHRIIKEIRIDNENKIFFTLQSP